MFDILEYSKQLLDNCVHLHLGADLLPKECNLEPLDVT